PPSWPPWSESPSRAPTREPAAPAEHAEAAEAAAEAAPATAPTPAPASPASTPPATGPTERERDNPPQDAPARDDNQQHDQGDHQAHGDRQLAGFVGGRGRGGRCPGQREGEFARERLREDRKSTRLNSSHRTISYAVFCLK